MGPATIKEDNEAAIALAHKGILTSERARRISVRYFFIKDRIESKVIVMEHLGTEDLVADILTKPLQGELLLKDV